MPRDKLPSISDYEPEEARVRTPLEQARHDRLFPKKHSDGRPRTLEERVTRVEAVSSTLVESHIDMAPKLAVAHAWAVDENNARESAMAHAEKTSTLLTMATAMIADVKRTQGMRESRTRLTMWAMAVPAAVAVIGLFLKVDTATLTGVIIALAGLGVTIVNAVVGRGGKVPAEGELGSSLRPPKT
jgi:hypothetical protein